MDVLVPILCVDDEPHILEGLSRALWEKFAVTTAVSGAEGLELLRTSGPFAVVVADMRMPRMDGATFLGLARQEAPDTSRVLLTGQTDLNAAIAAVNQGNIFEYLSKPCPEDELLAAIQAAAEQYRRVTADRLALTDTRQHERVLEVERKQLEEQLWQSQKLEAIGQLAGGVAHDFNNLLTVIIGYGELLLDQYPPDSPHRAPMELIVGTGQSAATLTQQLLAFSRRQIVTPQDIDLNAVITATERMLRRVIGEDIAFSSACAANVGLVRAIPGQIEQVLVNLVTNARDAMPGGGTLSMSTSAVTFSDVDFLPDPAAHLGSYVVVTIRDDGNGMDKSTRSRIFEPFFTTKEAGKGTGLGLAVVHSIILQQGGFITVDSILGEGTRFDVYLPAIERAPSLVQSSDRRPTRSRGNETILLVDDEARLRRVASLVLEGSGYTVLEAESGDDALSLVEQYVGRIDLVLTDVVMPGINGRVLVERLTARLPHLKALYMSGYTDDVMVRSGVIGSTVSLLDKPFAPLMLCQTVRQVLDRN